MLSPAASAASPRPGRLALLWGMLVLLLLALAGPAGAQTVDFRKETIYFLITTRFFDGDPSNNRPNEWASYDPTNPVRQITDPTDVTWKGDFQGLIQKLDYIKDLGFTAIWITPIVQNRGPLDYHGYHAWDFTKVDPRLESPGATFQDLINAVHARGMKIVLDVVTNHSGRFGIKGVAELKYNTDPTKPWYAPDNPNWQYDGLTPNPQDGKIWSRANLARMPAPYNSNLSLYNWPSTQSFVSTSDPTWFHHSGNGFAQGWDDTENLYNRALAGDTPDLNTENPVVRDYLVAAYNTFIDMGVDAFRWDTIKHMDRASVQYFIDQWKARNPNLFIFGEVAQKRHELHPVEAINPHWYTWRGAVGNSANSGMAVLDFYGEATFHNVFEMGGGFGEVQSAARYDHLYSDPSTLVTWLDNHDFGPNNDWNRRYGGSPENLAAAMNFMFTWRGIPVVYYGTEMQFMRGAYADIHDAADIEKSLNLTGRAYYGDAMVQAPNHRVYKHIRKLNAMRKAIPALQNGTWRWGGSPGGNGVGYIRESGSSYALVGLAKDGAATFNFTGVKPGTYRDAVTGATVTSTGSLSFRVEPSSAGVYVLNGPGLIGDLGAGYFQGGTNPPPPPPNTPVVNWTPENPTANQPITITVTNIAQGGKLHWGVNAVGGDWTTPITAYRPAGTVLHAGTGPAVQTPFSGPTNGTLTVTLPALNNTAQRVNTVDFAINFADNSWNSNGGADYHIPVTPVTVSHPLPTVQAVSPATVTAGGDGFVLTVDGSGFVDGVSKVRWNGIDRATTFVNTTQLTADILAGDRATAGTANVTVFNPTPGGGTSAAKPVTITTSTTNPLPVLTAINPAFATAGRSAFTVTVTGSGFVSGSKVRWNGVDRTTTYVNSAQLTASIPAGDVAAVGTANVAVFSPTPGGGTSAAQIFRTIPAGVTITPANPTIHDVVIVTVGNATKAAKLHWGVNDVGSTWVTPNTVYRPAGTVVFGSGPAVETPFTGPTNGVLCVKIGPFNNAAQAVARLAFVIHYADETWDNNGGADFHKTIATNPAPVLTTLSPASAAVGAAAFTLTATGSGFVAGSKIRWNGVDRTTTFVSATQLTAAIPASDVAAAGTRNVTVFSPAPGGGTSAVKPFTVGSSSNPLPVATSISPALASVGGLGFTLTVTGSGFVGGSKVRWNGVDRPTTVVSAAQLTAAIPASDLTAATTAGVTVFNPTPGGGTSAVQTLRVVPSGVSWSPANPTTGSVVTITVGNTAKFGKLHWGVNDVGSTWTLANAVYRPAGTTLWAGTGPAVESGFVGPTNGVLSIQVGPFNKSAQSVSRLAFVVHYDDNSWDNNNGMDYRIALPVGSARLATLEPDAALPTVYGLGQNHPNPFNPTAQIGYTLPERVRVRIEVFNAIGQRVAVLVDEVQDASAHVVAFDGSQLPTGLYLYRMTAGRFTQSRRMMLVK